MQANSFKYRVKGFVIGMVGLVSLVSSFASGESAWTIAGVIFGMIGAVVGSVMMMSSRPETVGEVFKCIPIPTGAGHESQDVVVSSDFHVPPDRASRVVPTISEVDDIRADSEKEATSGCFLVLFSAFSTCMVWNGYAEHKWWMLMFWSATLCVSVGLAIASFKAASNTPVRLTCDPEGLRILRKSLNGGFDFIPWTDISRIRVEEHSVSNSTRCSLIVTTPSGESIIDITEVTGTPGEVFAIVKKRLDPSVE